MLFFLFGGGTRYKALGPGAEQTCPRCHNTTTWTRCRRFHELTFFFIPVIRWGRREVDVCQICGQGQELPRPEGRRLGRVRHATA